MVEGTLLRWGNSYGIRVSKEDLTQLGLQEHEKVEVNIQKVKNPLLELFGSGKEKPISKKTIKSVREELGLDLP